MVFWDSVGSETTWRHSHTTIENSTLKEETASQASSKILLKKYLLTNSNLQFLSCVASAYLNSRFKYFFHFHRNVPEFFLYCCDFASGAVELVKVCLIFSLKRAIFKKNLIYLLLKWFFFNVTASDVICDSLFLRYVIFFFIFIYFLDAQGLCCCAHGLSLVVERGGIPSSCSTWASYCGGFSCYRAQALGHAGFSSCSSQALEHRFSSCGARASLPHGTWDLPQPGIERVIARQTLNHWTTREAHLWPFLTELLLFCKSYHQNNWSCLGLDLEFRGVAPIGWYLYLCP